jgi:hypothetical protein
MVRSAGASWAQIVQDHARKSDHTVHDKKIAAIETIQATIALTSYMLTALTDRYAATPQTQEGLLHSMLEDIVRRSRDCLSVMAAMDEKEQADGETETL